MSEINNYRIGTNNRTQYNQFSQRGATDKELLRFVDELQLRRDNLTTSTQEETEQSTEPSQEEKTSADLKNEFLILAKKLKELVNLSDNPDDKRAFWNMAAYYDNKGTNNNS